MRIELGQRNGDVVLAIADEGDGAEDANAGTGLSIVRALVRDELQGTFDLTARCGHARGSGFPRMTRTAEVFIVVRRGDEYLVVHRTPEGGGYWHGIAGGVEEGETTADAAARELAEETGLAGEPVEIAAPFVYVIDDGLPDQRSLLPRRCPGRRGSRS